MNKLSTKRFFIKRLSMLLLLIIIPAVMTFCSNNSQSSDVTAADKEYTNPETNSNSSVNPIELTITPVNPLTEAIRLVIDIVKYDPVMLELIDVTQKILANNPAKSEQLLASIVDMVKALETSALKVAGTDQLNAGISLLPMMGRMFSISNTTGESTPHVMVDMLQNLGDKKYTIPNDLLMLITYRNANGEVDFKQPRCRGNNPAYCNLGPDDNRSDFERLVELVDYADCGYIGPAKGPLSMSNMVYNMIRALPGLYQISEGTISEVMIDAFSRIKPNNVSNIVQLVNIFYRIPVMGKSMIRFGLQMLGCSGEAAKNILNNLPAARILAGKNGLEWMLQVANVFREQGQIRTLIGIYRTMAEDLRLDEDGNKSTISSLRSFEPVLISMIKAGAIHSVLRTGDILYSIPAGRPGMTAADLVIDRITMRVSRQQYTKL